MAIGPRYSVKFRRRRLNKTNYQKRLNLLKSKKPRLVLRRSNAFFYSQVIEYNLTGDKTLVSCSSKELQKLGWKLGAKNRVAAYLTGFLIAKKAADKNIKEVVTDLGLYTLTKGNKIFAFLRGVHDSGLISFSVSKEVFPSDEMLFNVMGKDVSKDAQKIIQKIIGDKK